MIRLCSEIDCTGCSACFNICGRDAISMKPDEKGFLRPLIDNARCVECGLCMKVCPILNEHDIKKPEHQEALKGWAKDNEIVSNSSSGGVFTLLAQKVLYENGSVYGASFDAESWNLRHIRIDSLEDLPQLQGSKYLQSDIHKTYRQARADLVAGRKVIFVGTPCQIAGLHFVLQHKEYPNLLTVDLVCHGVPSPMIFRHYVDYLNQQENSELVKYSFREKYWCWTRYNSLAIFKSGSKRRGKWEEDPYMRGFLRELFLRDSCHNCRFANMNRQGDITLADYWAYTRKPGEQRNRERGCSLILMNTDKGRDSIANIKQEVISYPLSIEEASLGNQALHHCFPKNPQSEAFWNDFRKEGFKGTIDKYLYPERPDLYYQIIYRFGYKSPALLVFRVLRKIYHVGKCFVQELNKIISHG